MDNQTMVNEMIAKGRKALAELHNKENAPDGQCH